MATDRKGNEIEVGDIVAIPCVVKEITEGVQHHLVLESLFPMPDGAPNRFALNEQQVYKASRPDSEDRRSASASSGEEAVKRALMDHDIEKGKRDLEAATAAKGESAHTNAGSGTGEGKQDQGPTKQ